MYSCRLPTELILRILRHVDPPDIIRWRTVSKWFSSITWDPDLWKLLYENAPFAPRIYTTSPFPQSSTLSLEYAVLRSAELSQSWTTPLVAVTPHFEMPFVGKLPPHCSHPKVIGGRWLLVCQSDRRFVVYDTFAHIAETRVSQILWEQNEIISDWNYFSWVPEEGQQSVGVYFGTFPEYTGRWRLLDFRLDSQSGTIRDAVTLDVPNTEYFGYVASETLRSLRGWPPFFFLQAQPLPVVFDSRTRSFYQFPEFRIALNDIHCLLAAGNYDVEDHSLEAMLATSTHILRFERFAKKNYRTATFLVQAFTVPENQSSADGILQLTHEGFTSQLEEVPRDLIRDSVADLITGSISVRFLDGCSDFRLRRCIDLILHKSYEPPVNVSSMTVCSHTAASNQPFCSMINQSEAHAGNGYGRGFVIQKGGINSPMNEEIVNMRYVIDATQDICRFTFGKPFSLPKGLKYLYSMDASEQLGISGIENFDCARGRISYVRHKAEEKILVVTDFK